MRSSKLSRCLAETFFLFSYGLKFLVNADLFSNKDLEAIIFVPSNAALAAAQANQQNLSAATVLSHVAVFDASADEVSRLLPLLQSCSCCREMLHSYFLTYNVFGKDVHQCVVPLQGTPSLKSLLGSEIQHSDGQVRTEGGVAKVVQSDLVACQVSSTLHIKTTPAEKHTLPSTT